LVSYFTYGASGKNYRLSRAAEGLLHPNQLPQTIAGAVDRGSILKVLGVVGSSRVFLSLVNV
jgi:hypothetical protein